MPFFLWTPITGAMQAVYSFSLGTEAFVDVEAENFVTADALEFYS